MTSLTPAPSTSTGMPRRLGATGVAVVAMYAAAPPAAGAGEAAAVVTTVAACLVALANQRQWRRALQVLGRGSGRHRADGRRAVDRDERPRLPLPRPRTAAMPTVETAAQGGTR